MRKRKYTTSVHVNRLLKMLKRGGTCSRCPASLHFSEYPARISYTWETSRFGICEVCCEFVGLKVKREPIVLSMFNVENCPCNRLGATEALRLTQEAIAKYIAARSERSKQGAEGKS